METEMQNETGNWPESKSMFHAVAAFVVLLIVLAPALLVFLAGGEK